MNQWSILIRIIGQLSRGLGEFHSILMKETHGGGQCLSKQVTPSHADPNGLIFVKNRRLVFSTTDRTNCHSERETLSLRLSADYALTCCIRQSEGIRA